MAGLVALCGLLAIGVAGRTDGGASLSLEVEQSARDALREASTHRGYWLLNAGFFVCGFHIAFIATHLPASLDDQGLGIEIGAPVLAPVGLFTILGSYVFGVRNSVWYGKGVSFR